MPRRRPRDCAYEVWDYLRSKRGGATIAEMRFALRRPESTIRKACRRLELKGFVRRNTDLRVHVFRRAPKSDWRAA